MTLTSTLAGFGLTWLVQSSALLVLGLTAGRMLKRSGPAVQSGIYRTTLAAVLICPLASAALGRAGPDGWTLRLPIATPDDLPAIIPLAAASQPSIAPAEAARPTDLAGAMPGAEPPPAPAERIRDVPSTPAGAETAPGPAPRPTISIYAAAAAIGLSAWLLGVAFLGLRLWTGQRRMADLRGGAIPADPDATALCRNLAGRLGVTTPGVLRSPFLFSPCLDGLRRPAILLPEEDEENLRETFIHELAHLARRDALWNLLRRWAVAIGWVQPLLWILSRRLEETAEEVCDDYVVQLGADRGRYAGHLLELAGRALPPVSPAGVGMVSLRTMLARRIVRILDASRAPATRIGSRAIATMLAAGLGGTLLAGLIGLGGERAAVAQAPPEEQQAPVAEAGRPDQAPTKTATIRGRILDLEGRPIAGVAVKTGSFYVPKSGSLATWLEATRQGQPPWVAGQDLNWNQEAPATAAHQATTDANGQFQLEGFDAERVVELELQGETMVGASIRVATREMDPIPATGFSNLHGPGGATIYGADFTFGATPDRLIEGVIKDASTNRPLEGAEVRSNRFAGSDFVGIMTQRTKTDAQGRFRLSGMPKGKGNQIIIVPNDEQPYLLQEIEIPDPPGADPVSVEVALPRGVWIEGTLTEKGTGKPVPGAWLHYIPFLENTFAQAHPSFDKHGNGQSSSIQDRYQTKADGSFRLVGLPGRAIVGANVNGHPYINGFGSDAIAGMNERGHFETYRTPINPSKLWPTSMKEIDPPANAEVVRVDLQVTTGPSVHLRAVDTDGNPVSGVAASGRKGRGIFEFDGITSSEIEITNLMPGEERTVALWHEGRKIGKVLRVREGDDANGPVAVTLEPTASMTGLVVDADGNPVAAARVRTDLQPSGDFSLHLPEVTTDEQGRFLVSDVPIGCDYSLAVQTMGPIKERRYAYVKDLTVRPNETTDAGQIQFKRN